MKLTCQVNEVGGYLHLQYRTIKLRKVCEDYGTAVKTYGVQMAKKLHQRVDELSAADSIDYLVKYNVGRCHKLDGDRDGQYAMDLVHPNRLVFEKTKDQVTTVEILEVVDYH